MSETDDWWRAHLSQEEQVIWHGNSEQKGIILVYRLPFWIFRSIAILAFGSGLLGLLLGLSGAFKVLVIGIFNFGVSYWFKALEENWRDNTVFLVTPHRAVAVSRQRIVDEVEIDAFLHFEQSLTGIHFPRRMGQWMYMDDPEGAYEALKRAQSLHQ
jgi:ABC-type uncharacterized transport system YnjBCD permease subunit